MVIKKDVGEIFSTLSVLFLRQRSHEGMIIVTPRNFTQAGVDAGGSGGTIKFAEADTDDDIA